MFPRSLAAVNSIIMLHAGVPLPVGTVASLAGVSRPVALSAVGTLEKRGLVLRSRRLRHDEVAPNTHSLYYPAAYYTALVDMPIDATIDSVRWFAVFVYGSMSKPGSAQTQSDIDLLIIARIGLPRAGKRLQIDLADLGTRTFGRAIDALIITPERARKSLDSGDPHMVNAIERGVRIRGEWP